MSPAVGETARRAAASAAGVALAALVAWASRPWWGDAPRHERFVALLPTLAVLSMAVALAPARWVAPVQAMALSASFLAWHLSAIPSGEGLPDLAVTGAAFLVAVAMPGTLGGRRALVALATVAMLGMLTFHRAWEHAALGPLLQLVMIAGHADLGVGRARAARIAQGFLAPAATHSTPVPLDGLAAVDRDPRSLLRGGAWIAGALAARAVATTLAESGHARPVVALAGGDLAEAGLEALVAWTAMITGVASLLFLDAGILRLFGFAMPAPMDQPWRSRDLLDYWRRANTWRYRMLVEGVQRLFLPLHGRWMPLGVLAVFLLSGVHHAAAVRLPGFAMFRWEVEGALCAANAWWRQRLARSRVRAWVTSGARPRRAAWTGAAAALAVILVHGFLANLSQHDRATRAIVLSWMPW